jgi:hypothetical protein
MNTIPVQPGMKKQMVDKVRALPEQTGIIALSKHNGAAPPT